MEVGRKGGSPEVGEVGRERGSRGEVVEVGARGGTWARWAIAKARVSREMVSKESESCEKAGRRRRRSEGAADSGLGAQSMVRLRGPKGG